MTETITIKWYDEKSVAAGERRKAQLENAGYTLIDTVSGIREAKLTYRKD